jgi:hypothetical protein
MTIIDALTDAPPTEATRIHGIPLLTPRQASTAGYVSITHDIRADTEAYILRSVATHRDPARSCFIPTGPRSYQLCLLRADVSDLASE